MRDTAAERRVTRLEVLLLLRDAQLAELQARLDDTRDEVVRTMAKLKTAASRAEAASGMAEAEVALQSLRSSGGNHLSEYLHATKLMQQSSREFTKSNYGGALYLATQAKGLAGSGRARLASVSRGTSFPGETRFAVPLRFQVSAKGNIRVGPGTTFPVAFTVDPGAELTGYSLSDEWIRVTDNQGRNGWVFRSLVVRP